MQQWKRPSSVPWPSVWGHHTGKRPMPNGKIPVFRIQDPTDEMIDEMMDHMNAFFIHDEPLCEETDFSQDKKSLEEIDKLWRECLKQRIGLVAFEVLEDGTTKLAGLNVTHVTTMVPLDLKLEGVAMQKVLGVVINAMDRVDVFKKYGVTEYMGAMGLSVAREYRGQGLGLAILQARVPLCKAVGLRLTYTAFTAGTSQELARRAGFELVSEMLWDEFQTNGEPVLPGLSGKNCKTMALKIE